MKFECSIVCDFHTALVIGTYVMSFIKVPIACLSARKKPTKMVTGVGDKDSCFDLFHAMGKILYCKRHHDRPLENTRAIADRSKARRPLQSDPIEVLEKSPMSADSFTCFLHQNCLEFFPDIHSVSEAAEYLSKADPLFNEWTGSGKVDLTEYGGLMGTMGLCYPRTQVFLLNRKRSYFLLLKHDHEVLCI